jgi:GcrA cell cycle regulator
MDWTDEVIERLRAFWAEGHSTAEIGRRMGVSKNAVVGKAHRLGLTARPSPIRRGGEADAARRPAIRRAVGPTLPPLSGPAEPVMAMGAAADAAGMLAHPYPAPVVRQPAAPLREVAAVREPPASQPGGSTPPLRAVSRAPGGRIIPCCWPIGEPGTRSFRFCDAGSAAGKPYCAEHAALAYVKVRDRREDAA